MRHFTRKWEWPLMTSVCQVFSLAPAERGSPSRWVEQSTCPLPVHLYFDSNRRRYRLIAVQGAKPVVNLALSRSTVLTQASSKFIQMVDPQTITIYGFGFLEEQQLKKFVIKVEEIRLILTDLKPESQSTFAVDDSDQTPVADEAVDESKCLRIENARLKGALAESCANAKTWEGEFATLIEVNKHLKEALDKQQAVLKLEVDLKAESKKIEIDEVLVALRQLLQNSAETSPDQIAILALLKQLQDSLPWTEQDKESCGQLTQLRVLHSQMEQKLAEMSHLHTQMAWRLAAANVQV